MSEDDLCECTSSTAQETWLQCPSHFVAGQTRLVARCDQATFAFPRTLLSPLNSSSLRVKRILPKCSYIIEKQ